MRNNTHSENLWDRQAGGIQPEGMPLWSGIYNPKRSPELYKTGYLITNMTEVFSLSGKLERACPKPENLSNSPGTFERLARGAS